MATSLLALAESNAPPARAVRIVPAPAELDDVPRVISTERPVVGTSSWTTCPLQVIDWTETWIRWAAAGRLLFLLASLAELDDGHRRGRDDTSVELLTAPPRHLGVSSAG